MLRQCPRCQSKNAVFIENDIHGWWEYCLYCGWSQDIGTTVEVGKTLEEAVEFIKRKKRDREPVLS